MKLRKSKRTPQVDKNYRSVPVNNYYRPPKLKSKKISTKDQNLPEKRRGLTFGKVFNILLVIVGVGLVVFATTLTTSPVVELRKNNAKYYDLPVYQKAAESAIRSSFFNRSKLLFQDKAFEQQLKSEFPEISNVKSSVPLGGRNLSVLITVSEPFAYVSSGSDNGVINKEGVLVTKNNPTVPDGLIKLRFTEPQSNFNVGSRILTADELKLISLADNELSALVFKDGSNASIKEILFNVADGQLEAKLVSKPFYIKFSTFTETDQQVGGAKATLRQLDRENKLPSQYLDIRVPGRAFVL